MGRDVPTTEKPCDGCGTTEEAVFDFMGDYFCTECTEPSRPQVPEDDKDLLFQQHQDDASIHTWRDYEGQLCISINYHDDEPPRSISLTENEEKVFMNTARQGPPIS